MKNVSVSLNSPLLQSSALMTRIATFLRTPRPFVLQLVTFADGFACLCPFTRDKIIPSASYICYVYDKSTLKVLNNKLSFKQIKMQI